MERVRLQVKAAAVAPEVVDGPPNLADVAKPAPGADPSTASAFMRGDDGTEAWLTKDGDEVVGYIRDGTQPDRALLIDDPEVWAQVVDGMGLVEADVPTAADRDAPEGGDESAPEGDSAEDGAEEEASVAAMPAPKVEGKAIAHGSVGRRSASVEGGERVVHTGIMIALMVPDGEGSDLALDVDQAVPPEELHVTLAYLGDISEVEDEGEFVARCLEAIREVTAKHDAVEGEVSGLGRFSAQDGDTYYLSYDSPGLNRLREDLFDALEEHGIEPARDHGFTPHITLATLAEGEGLPDRRVTPKPLTFERITLAFGGNQIHTPFGTDADDEAITQSASQSRPDSTANAAMDDPTWSVKGIGVGTDVVYDGKVGRVDLMVKSGSLPGIDGDIFGTAAEPVARVVLEDGSRVGVKVAGLQVGPTPEVAARLASLVQDYSLALGGMLMPPPAVDDATVKRVYARGQKSWTPAVNVPPDQWALGRARAFLAVAAGGEIPGYSGDRDLLPAGHPLAVKRLEVVDRPEVAPDGAAVVEAKSVETLLASLRGA